MYNLPSCSCGVEIGHGATHLLTETFCIVVNKFVAEDEAVTESVHVVHVVEGGAGVGQRCIQREGVRAHVVAQWIKHLLSNREGEGSILGRSAY